MIQNKTAHEQSHLIFSSKYVHSIEVGVGTFDVHAIFRNTAELIAHNERFAEKSNSALQVHGPSSLTDKMDCFDA